MPKQIHKKSEKIDVHLENFEGPLDLLMHLIRKSNIDIYDIPIAQITAEYLQYLELIQKLNLDTAGEFLVIAATLMQIKAKMLLPSPETDNGEDGPDPRASLVSMLEEYQRYKAAAQYMSVRLEKNKDFFYRGSPIFSDEEKMLSANLTALIEAAKKAFGKVSSSHELEGDKFPIETRIEKIRQMMKGRDWLLLDEIFATETHRLGVITCFMALLELAKQYIIILSQDEPCGQVRVYHSPEASEIMLFDTPFPEPLTHKG